MLPKNKIFGILFAFLAMLAACVGYSLASPPIKYGTKPAVNSDGTTDYTISSRVWESQPDVPVHNWVIRLPSTAFVENNWYAVEKTVGYLTEPDGIVISKKEFDQTNSYLSFQLDHSVKSDFQLSASDDDRNPWVLIQFNDSAVEDDRQSAVDRLELGVCKQRKSELPGLTTQGLLTPAELAQLQRLHPGKDLDPCRGDEELGSFLLRDRNGELLGKGYCGGGKRSCDAYLFTLPSERIRVLFHRDEFPYLQGHAEALVAFVHNATVKGNRCYIRQGRTSDSVPVGKDPACSSPDAEGLK
jgi:hypothetical protein